MNTPFLRSLAAAAVFLGSAVIPVLHEWSVGTAETAFHAQVSEPGRATLLPTRSGHRHHSDETCALCPLISRTAAAGSALADRAAQVGDGVLLPPFVTTAFPNNASRLPPTRAPPSRV